MSGPEKRKRGGTEKATASLYGSAHGDMQNGMHCAEGARSTRMPCRLFIGVLCYAVYFWNGEARLLGVGCYTLRRASVGGMWG